MSAEHNVEAPVEGVATRVPAILQAVVARAVLRAIEAERAEVDAFLTAYLAKCNTKLDAVLASTDANVRLEAGWAGSVDTVQEIHEWYQKRSKP